MTPTKTYLSLAILVGLWTVFTPPGCKEKNNSQYEVKQGTAGIVAVYKKPDGSKQLDIMLRQIVKMIKYDSAKKKDLVVIDTLWGRADPVLAKDSLGHQLFDSLKRPLYRSIPDYVLISKDSVVWKISGVPVDSLLKK